MPIGRKGEGLSTRTETRYAARGTHTPVMLGTSILSSSSINTSVFWPARMLFIYTQRPKRQSPANLGLGHNRTGVSNHHGIDNGLMRTTHLCEGLEIRPLQLLEMLSVHVSVASFMHWISEGSDDWEETAM